MPWYRLKMGCPVSGCTNQCKLINWVCADDRDDMYVCEEGRLACEYRKHNNLVCNWKFDCGDRNGLHRNTHFLSPDLSGFAHALAIGIPLLEVAGAQWIGKLLANVERQYKG